MNETNQKCVFCERNSEQIPLLNLIFKGHQYWICPEHFPFLIHSPAELIGKLPGAELLHPHDH
jgi:hypothetical protein